jgi:hypothetical protein
MNSDLLKSWTRSSCSPGSCLALSKGRGSGGSGRLAACAGGTSSGLLWSLKLSLHELNVGFHNFIT